MAFFLLKTSKESCYAGILQIPYVQTTCVLKDKCRWIYFFSVFFYMYFDIDPSAALFHIEPHRNTSGFWSIWFTNNFDFSIELNEVFIARETKNILKVSFTTTSCNVLPLRIWHFDIQKRF